MQIPSANVDTIVITLPASAYRLLCRLAEESNRPLREHASLMLQLAVVREAHVRRRLFEEGERG